MQTALQYCHSQYWACFSDVFSYFDGLGLACFAGTGLASLGSANLVFFESTNLVLFGMQMSMIRSDLREHFNSAILIKRDIIAIFSWRYDME